MSVVIACNGLAATAQAEELIVPIATVSASGPAMEVGYVRFRDTEHGLLVTPALRGLTPGPHGTHLHERPHCGSTAGSPADGAGNHYDPQNTGRHTGPYGDGHLGDLPNLIVEADGSATIPVLAPRLRLADLRGRAIIVHAGADRYEAQATEHDHAAHGHGHGHATGGARMYCGVVPAP